MECINETEMKLGWISTLKKKNEQNVSFNLYIFVNTIKIIAYPNHK